MRVLIACEFSGIVRSVFEELGHFVLSCDIIDTEIPGNHYKGDVRDIINDGWDLMIAHPPCTYLSNVGARHLFKNKKLNEDRYLLGLKAKDFFMELYESKIEKICIENPVPSKIFNLPNYSQIISPSYFGHEINKRTCLWLKNLPELKPTTEKIKTINTVHTSWYKNGGKNRQKNRSITFYGIAKAMGEQWGI